MKQTGRSRGRLCVRFGGVVFLLLAGGQAQAASLDPLQSTPVVQPEVGKAPPLERWAGRQVVLGEQSFTLVGTVDTRAESYVLADVRRYPDRYVLTQYTCRVDLAEVAGVSAEMSDASAQSVPAVTIEIPRAEDGTLKPVRWVADWGRSDLDGDGYPGLTVASGAPFCGGDLYLSSRTTTKAFVFERDRALEASVDVTVEQSIMDTSNVCLDLATSDSTESVTGRVKYVPVKNSATCASLLREGWPVAAPL